MKRPPLRKVPLQNFDPAKPGQITVTLSVGQWDAMLQGAYDQGFFLLELDDDEKAVALYRKETK